MRPPHLACGAIPSQAITHTLASTLDAVTLAYTHAEDKHATIKALPSILHEAGGTGRRAVGCASGGVTIR